MKSRILEEAQRRLAAQLDRWNLPLELAAELLDPPRPRHLRER
jgi:hypothetical protein